MTGEPFDVAVVGYGPVGATLAGLLARRGLRTVVLDRDTEIFPLPRAAHIDSEALRVLQELGCADEMAAAMQVNVGMDFLTADHRVLLEMRGSPLASDGWPSSQFIFQPLFEQQLRDAVVASGADVRLGVGVRSVGDTNSHDPVVLDLDDGTSVAARVVVGCDGARSTVRRALGITMDDLGFEEPWLVVDLVLDEHVDDLPTHALQICDPARPHTLVPMPTPRFRFEFMLLADEDADAVQHPDVVQRLIAPWIPEGHARVERSAVYTFHGLIAHEWRRGRVMLAGDAAHQMPPFLGQGMCSGLRDAANLAWKIDAVVRGASPDLLDTYQAEREPHVRAIVEAAVGFGRIICTTDVSEATSRDEMMLAARAAASGAPAAPGGIPLPPLSGRLVGHGGGRPSAQPTLDGTRLDDLVGPRWLVVTNEAADRDTVQALWGDLAVVLSCQEHPALSAVLGEDDDGTPFAVAVVRPDRYVSLRSMHPSDAAIPPLVSGNVTQ